MIAILIVIIFLLVLLNYMQFKAKQNRSNQLTYIDNKLSQIMKEPSSQRILLMSNDPEMISLLTRLNQLIDEHQHAQIQYRDTEQSMRRMLSNISHDLKTPLTVVLGYIETILHRPVHNTDELHQLLTKVHHKAEEIVTLINTFFDLAKLESGDTELSLKLVNMNEICRNNLLLFYEVAEAQGLRAEIDIPEQSISLLSNEDALNRILNNLLSNAIQYGHEGKVVGLSLYADSAEVTIKVWDEGRGIEEHQQDKIFERMYTLEDSRNKAFQGSGLGLTITKRLVEKLGGTIQVNSLPYERTTFTVKFLKDMPFMKGT